MKQFLYFSMIILLFLSFGSCKKKKPNDGREETLSTGIIRIACDEDFKNLANAAIDAFEARNDRAFIIPIFLKEDEVIRLLLEDSVRLALTTRDLSIKEQKVADGKNMYLRKFLIAFEGIAFLSNKANPDSLIGFPTIQKILRGEITEWSQINPKSPLGTIRVVFDSNQSGITRYVVDSITKGESQTPYLYAMNSIEDLLERICEFPNAIGIVGFNQISNEIHWKTSGFDEKIRIMRIGREEKATLQNTFFPFAGDVISENYPFWRPLYVLLSDPKMGLASGFSIFLAGLEGQLVVYKSGLLPSVSDPQNRRRIEWLTN